MIIRDGDTKNERSRQGAVELQAREREHEQVEDTREGESAIAPTNDDRFERRKQSIRFQASKSRDQVGTLRAIRHEATNDMTQVAGYITPVGI